MVFKLCMNAIAARLPGRTDNEIKNYWNTHIRKRLLRMGIDPVTHSPRLDLLDLSSILGSSLYHSPQMNVSRLLGIQSIVNPELLRLATMLSSQRDNPEFLLQNLQENALNNPQLQNQFQFLQPNQLQTPIQDIPACTTSTASCAQFMGEPQLMQANVEQFSSDTTNLNCQNTLQNLWQTNGEPSSALPGNLVPLPNYSNCASDRSLLDPISENWTFEPNDNIGSQNFSFPSVLSTPSSSPTPLNSSSTHFNSSNEDERDSYCSNLLPFELSDMLDVNDFM